MMILGESASRIEQAIRREPEAMVPKTKFALDAWQGTRAYNKKRNAIRQRSIPYGDQLSDGFAMINQELY